MYPFVLFEGLDYTGKTTIARVAATQLHGVYLRSPPLEHARYREGFDAAVDKKQSLTFYLTGNLISNLKAKEHLERHPVVLDRHFPSTVAYHAPVLGRNLDEHLDWMDPAPKVIYYLTADVKTLGERARLNGGMNGFFDEAYLKQVGGVYERIFAGNSSVVRIDTTDLSLDDAKARVFDDLRERRLINDRRGTD